MHQAILVDADVDEGAEVGDVGHRALQRHALPQVVEGLHPFQEFRRLELRARVPPRFFQLRQDVPDRGQAKLVVGELGRVQAAQGGDVADQFADALAGPGEDAPHHRVGLGVDGGGIQGLVAIRDAQEAGAELEGLVPQAGHGLEGGAVGEGAVLLAVADDVLRQAAAEAGDLGQQGHRGGVEVHAHGVDAVLHHLLQGAGELGLVDVMLVLTDADGLGLDLDQLRQRVL